MSQLSVSVSRIYGSVADHRSEPLKDTAVYQVNSIMPPADSTASLAQSGVVSGTAAANRPRKNAIPFGLVISVRKPTRSPCSRDVTSWTSLAAVGFSEVRL